jgi:uncharacterized protein YggE
MTRTVTVTGQGSARVVPDIAVVRLAAAHRAADVAGALAGVNDAVATAGAVARRFTDPARVTSTGLSVWPAYDQQGATSGYEARHGLRVVVDYLAVAGTLLTALAAEVGDALRVEGVALEVGNPGPAARDAREAAYADARARAEHLAGLAGTTLAEVVSVVEGGGVGMVEAPVAFAAGAKDVAFEPGERAIASTLSVTWALVP